MNSNSDLKSTPILTPNIKNPPTSVSIDISPNSLDDSKTLSATVETPQKTSTSLSTQTKSCGIPTPPKKISIVTWNIHGFRGSNGEFNFKLVAEKLKKKKCDIVCLQEVWAPQLISQHNWKSGTPIEKNYLYQLADILGFKSVVWAPCWPSKGNNHTLGNAILSRFDMLVSPSDGDLEIEPNIGWTLDQFENSYHRVYALKIGEGSYSYSEPRSFAEAHFCIPHSSGLTKTLVLFNGHLCYHSQYARTFQLEMFFNEFRHHHLKWINKAIPFSKSQSKQNQKRTRVGHIDIPTLEFSQNKALSHPKDFIESIKAQKQMQQTRPDVMTPHIVCGDMNAFTTKDYPKSHEKTLKKMFEQNRWNYPSTNYCYDIFSSYGYTDLYTGAKFPENLSVWVGKKTMRIDYFFASKQFQLQNDFVVESCSFLPWTASDHYPLELVLKCM